MPRKREEPLTRKKAEAHYYASRLGVYTGAGFTLLGLLIALLIPAIATIGWIVFGISLFTCTVELVNMSHMRSKLRPLLTGDREKAEYESRWGREIAFCAVVIAATILPVALFAPAISIYAWIALGLLMLVCIWNLIAGVRSKPKA